jgi:hypothetical protein
MITILQMLFPTLEPATSVAILGLTFATTAALAFLIVLARRRRSYSWLPMAILAVGFSATAFASWFGMRMFAAAYRSVATTGGGIGAIAAGIGEAAQLPMTAAWIALITSLVAAMFLRQSGGDDDTTGGRSRPATFGVLMAVGLTSGLAPLLAFHPAIVFVLRAITPGTAMSAAKVMDHFVAYEVISACCFVAAAGVIAASTRLARRSMTSQSISLVMTIALLVTVAVSAFTAAGLRDTSARFREVARYGHVSALPR